MVYCLSRRSYARELGNNNNQPQQSTSISLQEIFEYTKYGYQNYLVPLDTTSLQIDAWGASGADVATTLGGFGSYISTNISVIPGQILYIFVGKRGTRSNQTLIGGENGEDTDVRLQWNNLDSRIIVANGGRGASIFPWSIGSKYMGTIGNGVAVGTTGTLFGDPTSSSSYTTGRQLYLQEGVRRGHGKVVIRRHRSQRDRLLQISIPQHKIYIPFVSITGSPTTGPSQEPTVRPTIPPTVNPSTFYPTIKPTMKPTLFPTLKPTVIPTQQPTSRPSRIPSTQPSRMPTNHPSSQPSKQPVGRPSGNDSLSFLSIPVYPLTDCTSYRAISFIIPGQPSRQPTRQPTRQPVGRPTSQPSRQPTRQPTMQPSRYVGMYLSFS